MSRLAFAALLAAQWFGGGEKNTREGAEHFENGRLEEALRAFSRAEGAYPEAVENDLNIAGVHYRMGEAGAAEGEEGPFREAARGYQAALQAGAEGTTRRDAFFNLANTLFRGGAFREAAAAYGEVIALDPQDLEARQNLERALRRADEQEQQGQGEQEEQEEGQPDGEPGDSEESEGGRQKAPGDRPPPEEADEAPPEAAPGADAPDPESSAGPVPEISPEQAERILAALAEVERAFQEAQLEKRRARALRRGRH